MPYFCVTLKQGRSDNLTFESESKTQILTFFNTVSTAKVSCIKSVEYSKTLDINYVKQTVNITPFYKKINILAKTNKYTDYVVLYNVKTSVTDEQLLREIKKLYINDEKIEDIISIIKFT